MTKVLVVESDADVGRQLRTGLGELGFNVQVPYYWAIAPDKEKTMALRCWTR